MGKTDASSDHLQWIPIRARRVSPALLALACEMRLLICSFVCRVKAIMFVLLRSFVFTHLDQRPNFIKKLSLCVLLCPVAL